MRDIKFRAWHKGYPKTGHIPATNSAMLFESRPGETLGWLADGQPIEVMQFTGLKDKNDKEIYEDDIIKFHYFYQSLGANLGAQESEHELVGVIKMGTYGWGIEAITGEHWHGHTGYGPGEGESSLLELCAMNESSIHEESFEVLGNLHSNPELLQP
jgi:uncharacterized phage protein (TIGR01671 family)